MPPQAVTSAWNGHESRSDIRSAPQCSASSRRPGHRAGQGPKLIVGHHFRRALYVLAAVMLVLFLPAHYKLTRKFPIVYRVVFLGTLAPPVVLAGALQGRTPAKTRRCLLKFTQAGATGRLGKLMHRARSLWSQADLTDGKLPGASDDPSNAN